MAHQPEGLVSIERMRVEVGGPPGPVSATVVERAFPTPHPLVRPLTLDFDALDVPEGVSRKHLSRLKLMGFEAWAYVAMPTLITVSLRLVPVEVGSGRIYLAAAPLGCTALHRHDEACTVD